MVRRFLRSAPGLVLAVWCIGNSALANFADHRAIFVDRFDYTPNASNITSVMENAANMGFTDVVFQVRGRADAFYDSNFEPRASNVPAGFDPLATAVAEAHARGLKLHAWINSTPMWNTTALNPPPGHVYHNTNPSFRLMDIHGNLEPQDGWSNYSSVNPVLPEVHTHINNVVNDIAANYDVDGVHLDYIRYVPGTSDFDRLPHDPIAHQMFTDATGLNGANPANATAYKNFIKGRITDLVASIKNTVDAAEVSTGRTIDLGASVWRDPNIGENDYLQDYRTWLENDLLDIAMPMIYIREAIDNLFNSSLANVMAIPTNARVAPTIGMYLHDGGFQNGPKGDVDYSISQLERLYNAGTDGAGIYDYSAVFTGSLADERQAALTSFYANLTDPVDPMPVILAGFESNEDPFGFNYDTSPVSQTFGLADGTTIERVTSEAFEGGASQELKLVSDGSPEWQLRHNAGVGAPGNPANNTPFVTEGYVGVWIKTTDSVATVELAIDDPGTADRAIAKEIIGDGQWRLYEWNLEDDDQWEGWVNGDGSITGLTTTLDSIFFRGSASATIYMDLVMHNPDGSLLPEILEGDYTRDGVVGVEDFLAWKSAFGQSVEAGTGADGNGDGAVDAADFTVWRDNLGNHVTWPGGLSAHGTVPEPATLTLLLLSVALLAPQRLTRIA